ncbi:acyl-CoA dehydrogenase, N-terminal domain protein [Mycobacterium xenopi 4042]|uniref:Acyl-CoA dehydrogenase, N-terminal domain protein n=1 Tax=Mycobacterium xenopi 4042 TaxID=1299334 RepID=X7Z3H2_MYCXE|nr:acyl-CoA dehydrogenase, N-terminal domain protein [Mycobacterium xenopi 4042]
MVVVEELGRAVAPGPFVPTVVTSAVIAHGGTAEQKARLLPGLVDGTITGGVGLEGDVVVDGGVANGEAGIVFGAGLADVLLIAAGEDVLLLDRGRDGVSIEVPTNTDPTRRSGRVTLSNVAVTADDILPGARESALARARVLVAAEAVGGRRTASTPPSSMRKCASSSAAPLRPSRRSSITARTCWWVPSRRPPRCGTRPGPPARTRSSSG